MASSVEQLIGRDGHRCAWCGRGLKSRGLAKGNLIATADHVIPKSKGGGNALDNLILACHQCNGRRGDMDADLFLEVCRSELLNVQTVIVIQALDRVRTRLTDGRRRRHGVKVKNESVPTRRYPANACPKCGGSLLVKSGVSRRCLFCWSYV